MHVLFNRDHEEYFDPSFVDAKIDIGWIESYTRGMAETAYCYAVVLFKAIRTFVLIDCDSIFFPAGKFMSFASGCVSVFESSNPHSFSQINESGFIDKVKKKKRSVVGQTPDTIFP